MEGAKYPFPETRGLPLLRAEIILSGDGLDPEIVEAAVPLEGAEAARRGEKRREPLPPYPETYWRFFVALESQLLDDAVVALLDRIEPYRDQLVVLGGKPGVDAYVMVIVTLTLDGCIYELRPRTLGRLAAFEAPFLLSIYDLTEEDDMSDLSEGVKVET